MPRSTADRHDWHQFDTWRGLEVRQVSLPLSPNQWEVRDPAGRTAVLSESEFQRLRDDPQWLPEELR